jgi:hypothetical protein
LRSCDSNPTVRWFGISLTARWRSLGSFVYQSVISSVFLGLSTWHFFAFNSLFVRVQGENAAESNYSLILYLFNNLHLNSMFGFLWKTQLVLIIFVVNTFYDLDIGFVDPGADWRGRRCVGIEIV